ncbi:MAG: ATP-binding cassette domain-containing protein [Clostridiales bacterium]|nr:ATP-binding cassette domain-containing protein [Candidatus Scatonaster coprocaballi]
MKLVLEYLRRHMKIFLISTIFLTMEAFADLLQPTFMSLIVDEGIQNVEIRTILKYGLIMLAIALVGACSAVMRNHFASRTSQTVGKELRHDMYAKSVTAPKGDIEFKSVKFGYTEEKTVLQDITLKIPAGTQVAIVGPTGSGKTTIINLLTRFYDVNDGEILLDGVDLRDYKLGDLRDSFGVVLQDTSLFAISVRDNISYGHEEASSEDIVAAAKVAGADSFIRRLPQGYDTILEQGGSELSQGERQLLTIARAVLTNAPIMILDEATSSVDTVTEQKIRRAMLKICENRTSFIIAHRLSTIRDSDIIILIEDGRIAEQGNHQELLALNGKYAQMYKTQMGLA